jgi:hypothetical protein
VDEVLRETACRPDGYVLFCLEHFMGLRLIDE